MESKFHLIPVGQHFEWEGKSYIKSTPLLATQVPEGGQKFMPRAALVKIVGTEGTPTPIRETPDSLDTVMVRSALARYHQRCIHLCAARAHLEGGGNTQLQDELEQFYRDLLAELKL